MSMPVKNGKFIFIILILTGLYGCYKDEFSNPPNGVTFNGDLCLPVATVTWRVPHMVIPDIEHEINDSVTLPDSLRFAYFKFSKFREHFDFDISGTIEKPEFINLIEVKLNVTNEFPGELIAQVVFIGDDDQAIDSVFSDAPFICPASEMNPADGQLLSVPHIINTVIIDASKYENFHNSKSIRLNFALENRNFDGEDVTDAEVINYFNHYSGKKIEVYLSIRISFDAKI